MEQSEGKTMQEWTGKDIAKPRKEGCSVGLSMDDKFDIHYIVQISPVYVINTEKKIIDLS